MAWPTTDKPRRNFATLRMTDDEATDMDAAIAAGHARNRSDAQRLALDDWFVKVGVRKRGKKRAQKKGGTP